MPTIEEQPRNGNIPMEEYKPLKIDPLRQTFKGPLSTNPLNAYFALPQQEQKYFLAGLVLASRWVPSEKDHAARDRGQVTEIDIEYRYGMVADGFAKIVDNNYQAGAFK